MSALSLIRSALKVRPSAEAEALASALRRGSALAGAPALPPHPSLRPSTRPPLRSLPSPAPSLTLAERLSLAEAEREARWLKAGTEAVAALAAEGSAATAHRSAQALRLSDRLRSLTAEARSLESVRRLASPEAVTLSSLASVAEREARSLAEASRSLRSSGTERASLADAVKRGEALALRMSALIR
jgi:hypothetical protein